MIDNISLISVGLRHRRQFGIAERAGEIIDHIAHDDRSPFGKDFFIKTDALLDQRNENKGRIIYDKTEKNSIVVDIDSLILSLATSNIDQTLERINDEFIPYLESIASKYDIENFNRIGLVFEFTGKEVDFLDKLLHKITNGTFATSNDLAITFASRAGNIESLVMNNLLDYKNYLISIRKNKKEEGYHLKFDYQFYFKPEIRKTNDIDFKGFIKEARLALSDKFLKWINQDA